MRRNLLWLLFAGGCANAQSTPDAAPPDAPAPDAEVPDAEVPDATTAAGMFLDDSATDFAGGTLDTAVIETWGAVAPRAYYTGALRVRASDTGTFTNAAAANWSQVEAMPATSRRAPGRSMGTSWGTSFPAGLGLSSGDDFTLLYDGEIYLEAGLWTFYLSADDHAFLEMAQAGSATFSRVISMNAPTEVQGNFVAMTTGWYPIRLAFCEQTSSAALDLDLSGPGVGGRTSVTRQRLRFPASGMTGMAMAGFDDGHLLGDQQATIDAAAPAGTDWAAGLPADLGVTSADDFAVRWSGQLLVDTDGDYTFRYVTDDGQRLWIDGELLLDTLDDATHDATTSALHLDPGWHDLVVDHTEHVGGAQAFLGVTTGPAFVGPSLPVDHLRPVEARSERFDSGVDRTDRAIADLGQVESSIAIDAPAGAKTHGVDVGWTFTHGYQGDLEITLIAPDGSYTMVRDHTGGAASGSVTERVHVTGLDEANANGVWKLRVHDTVSLHTGTLTDFQITVHYDAGTPPIAPAATYDSTVKDLGPAVTAYESLSWSARLGPGSAVRVYARSADSPDTIVDEAWSDPIIDPDAGAPPVAARRYFQYRIELLSDGDGAAMVDWIRLDTLEEVP